MLSVVSLHWLKLHNVFFFYATVEKISLDLLKYCGCYLHNRIAQVSWGDVIVY